MAQLFVMLLLGAGEHVSVGKITGWLAAKRRAAPSVWHPGVSSSIFCCCRFSEVRRTPNSEKDS
jgi:hypothetical protein